MGSTPTRWALKAGNATNDSTPIDGGFVWASAPATAQATSPRIFNYSLFIIHYSLFIVFYSPAAVKIIKIFCKEIIKV